MKRVLIVGGMNDIGLSIANKLNSLGYIPVIGYNNTVIDTKYECIKCDIKSDTDIENVFKNNKYDILINLANINRDSYYIDKTREEFMEVLNVNLVGTYLLNKEFIKNNDNGIIINFSSTDGIDTGSLYSIDYACSKAGIITMSRILSNVSKVYSIIPNWINSNSTKNMDKSYLDKELDRIGQSRLIEIDEIADVIENIINNKYNSNIIRVDIKDDKLWIEELC